MSRACLPAIFLCAAIAGASRPAAAAEATVAVAANFAAALEEIGTAFTAATGHRIVVVAGATGALLAQCAQGAPFDAFLAADGQSCDRLEREGLAVAGTRRTYAIGRLALWSADKALVDSQGVALRRRRFAHLAIANPDLAPYGAAAVAVLDSLGLAAGMAPRLVTGQSVAQAYQFIASGAAELGFVALAQVWRNGAFTAGSGWIVPDGLYPPLRQDAVLLRRGAGNPAAAALLAFLADPRAVAIMDSYGYRQEH